MTQATTEKGDKRMKNKILLSTLLLASVIAIGTTSAFAATSATQTVTGRLGTMKIVEGIGTGLLQNMTIVDENNAQLDADMLPAFRVTTNNNASQFLYMTASCPGGTGQNAITGDGTNNYIILGNITHAPAAGAVASIIAGTSADNNENALALKINDPVVTSISGGGALSYAWNAGNNGWRGTISHKGVTKTDLTIPASTNTKTNSFSFDDEEGDYQSTILLSFNP